MEQKFNNNRLDLQILREFCEREGEEIAYRKGDQLEREGDPARWFAFVTEGCFKYVKYGVSDDKAPSVCKTKNLPKEAGSAASTFHKSPKNSPSPAASLTTGWLCHHYNSIAIVTGIVFGITISCLDWENCDGLSQFYFEHTGLDVQVLGTILLPYYITCMRVRNSYLYA